MPRASGVFLVTFVRITDEGCRRFIGESLTVFFTPLLQIQSNPKLDSKTKNSKNNGAVSEGIDEKRGRPEFR